MDISFENKIKIMFRSLERGRVGLQDAGQLSKILYNKIKNEDKAAFKKGICLSLTPKESSVFATAALEMWQRAVHSFLISCSLDRVSPIWSVVSGYYSSHYCIRAFAHLLGYFQLHRKVKCQARFIIKSGKHYCDFLSKDSNSREHKFYWNVVKKHSFFASNDLFTVNLEDVDESDVAHRSMANYFDHLGIFPVFHPFDEQELKDRIEHLSKVDLTAWPIPNRSNFPDTNNVQLIAYLRIIFFRDLLNEVLGNKFNSWKQYRSPSWATKYLNYQGQQLQALMSVYGGR